MKTIIKSNILAIIICLTLPALTYGKPTRIDAQETDITIHPNKTTTTLTSIKQTLNSPGAARAGQQASIPYFPSFESVTLVKAYRESANGLITNVPMTDVYMHPAQAAKDAPGYTKQMVKTLVYPQLVPGDTIFAEWKIVTKSPPPFGFMFFIQPNFALPTTLLKAVIHYPASMQLHWTGSTTFTVDSQKQGNNKILTITAKDQPGHVTQPFMVSPHDVLPYFEISQLPTWGQFGNIWAQFYRQQLIITPNVRAQALEIAGGSTGLAALRKFYNWISNYINYIDISPDLKSNYVPHTPQEILTNGYGDCKDYAMLMVAFAKVVGIDVEPAMINWGYQYRKYPLPTSKEIDHAIVYVPKYHLFLNPTNIYSVFGALDVGLRDKEALTLSQHSKMVDTPAGDPNKNRNEIFMKTQIKNDGNLKINYDAQLFGSLATELRARALQSGVKGILETVNNLTPDIMYLDTYKAINLEELNEPLQFIFSETLPNFLHLNPTSYFPGNFELDAPVQLFIQRYILSGNRLYPFVIGAKTLTWDEKTHLPPHFVVSYLPHNFRLSNEMGSYQLNYVDHKTWYELIAKLVINKDIYKSSQYTRLRNLLIKPINLQRRVVVIKDMRRN